MVVTSSTLVTLTAQKTDSGKCPYIGWFLIMLHVVPTVSTTRCMFDEVAQRVTMTLTESRLFPDRRNRLTIGPIRLSVRGGRISLDRRCSYEKKLGRRRKLTRVTRKRTKGNSENSTRQVSVEVQADTLLLTNLPIACITMWRRGRCPTLGKTTSALPCCKKAEAAVI